MSNNFRVGAVGVAAGAVLLSLVAPAHAATGWRITATPDKNSGLRDIAVTGPNDAWAVGYQSVKDDAVPVVRRWNGKVWNRVALPAAVKGAYLEHVSASSSTNVWVGGSDGHLKQFWMRWNGKNWKVVTGTLPKGSDPHSPDVLALGAGDVWSFAQAGKWETSVPDVRHFNGRSWSKVRVPGPIAGASAVSGKSIWATSWAKGKQGPKPTLLRWNGKTWAQRSLPLGEGSGIGGVLAFSDKNVWVSGMNPGALGVLLHWNGKSWKTVVAPKTSGVLQNLVYDGNGGLWMRAGQRFLHYKSGKWSSAAVPGRPGVRTAIAGLARVPKTTSVWGVGALDDKDWINTASVVVKYGK
ncbi:hypothetical protein [Actinomadura hibisca]|uniref:hypothetical protein n=1 Tax=Actinomadura hibisca TaxID=68565 RepID=UPI00082B2454|nr:hypothetical protein [Actinomadura hibisca]